MLKMLKGFVFGILTATGIFSILINIGFYEDAITNESKMSKSLNSYLKEEE